MKMKIHAKTEFLASIKAPDYHPPAQAALKGRSSPVEHVFP
jgi:hypothetical protein